MEFPEDADMKPPGGHDALWEAFFSACLELSLFYKHPLDFQN